LGSDFRNPNSLPEPVPTDAIAIAFKDGRLILYLESAGRVAGYILDIIDGFNLSYLMLGATLQQLRDMGEDTAEKAHTTGMINRKEFEQMFKDVDLGLEKPWSKRSDDKTSDEAPPDDLRFF